MPHAHLTAKFVSAAQCPPGKRKIEYIDRSLEGFFVEALKSGVKTYYQRYVDAHRQQRQVKIGRVGVVPLDEARQRALQIKTDVALGRDPLQDKKELRTIPTLRDFALNRYLPFVKQAKRSWRDDERMLRNHVLPELGSVYLNEITPPMIIKLMSDMKARGLAHGTCNRPVVILRYMLNLASDWGIPRLDKNPAKKVAMYEEAERQRFLSDAETRRLVDVLRSHPDRLGANAVELLLMTGARRNEILHARWEHVDLEKATLLVPLSKSGKPRLIALSRAAIDLIQGLQSKGRGDWLFPAGSGLKPLNGLQRRWEKIRCSAQLPDVRLHDLRHSYASYLVNSGVSLYVVQQLLGHSQPRTTQRYAHLHRSTLNEAADLAAATVQRAMER